MKSFGKLYLAFSVLEFSVLGNYSVIPGGCLVPLKRKGQTILRWGMSVLDCSCGSFLNVLLLDEFSQFVVQVLAAQVFGYNLAILVNEYVGRDTSYVVEFSPFAFPSFQVAHVGPW